ncbi:MAG: hypothetical protein P4L39_06415 [Humidesulfovibrio sp.]|nr:hypothetical protein [Humidesulfovibrio sp.]
MTAHPRRTAALNTRFFARTLLRALAGASLLCVLAATQAFAQPRQAPAALNDDTVLRRMDTVLDENARLRDDAWKARKQGHEAAKQAEDALAASDEQVEKTRVEALAHVAGVSPAQVEDLRKNGRSWGQAAGDLGVHPGFLGIGKAPLYESPSHKVQAAPGKTKHGKKARQTAAKAAGRKDLGRKAKPVGKAAAKVEHKPEHTAEHKAVAKRKGKKAKHKE